MIGVGREVAKVLVGEHSSLLYPFRFERFATGDLHPSRTRRTPGARRPARPAAVRGGAFARPPGRGRTAVTRRRRPARPHRCSPGGSRSASSRARPRMCLSRSRARRDRSRPQVARARSPTPVVRAGSSHARPEEEALDLGPTPPFSQRRVGDDVESHERVERACSMSARSFAPAGRLVELVSSQARPSEACDRRVEDDRPARAVVVAVRGLPAVEVRDVVLELEREGRAPRGPRGRRRTCLRGCSSPRSRRRP